MWPGDIVRALADAVPAETIVTTDVGSHKYLFGQYWPSRHPETFWMSNGLSGMGYGLSAAFGAKLAKPDVPVLAAVGDGARTGAARADVVIDCRGTTVMPGLIDSHCHVVLGDYTPRQKTVDFLDSYVHGGITSVVSAGEGVHAPGRPHDPAASKALADLDKNHEALIARAGAGSKGRS